MPFIIRDNKLNQSFSNFSADNMLKNLRFFLVKIWLEILNVNVPPYFLRNTSVISLSSTELKCQRL